MLTPQLDQDTARRRVLARAFAEILSWDDGDDEQAERDFGNVEWVCENDGEEAGSDRDLQSLSESADFAM